MFPPIGVIILPFRQIKEFLPKSKQNKIGLETIPAAKSANLSPAFWVHCSCAKQVPSTPDQHLAGDCIPSECGGVEEGTSVHLTVGDGCDVILV